MFLTLLLCWWSRSILNERPRTELLYNATFLTLFTDRPICNVLAYLRSISMFKFHLKMFIRPASNCNFCIRVVSVVPIFIRNFEYILEWKLLLNNDLFIKKCAYSGWDPMSWRYACSFIEGFLWLRMKGNEFLKKLIGKWSESYLFPHSF